MSAPKTCEMCPLVFPSFVGIGMRNLCKHGVEDHRERLIPGPSCPFVLLDAKDKRIAELETAMRDAINSGPINARVRLTDALKATPPPEPEVCSVRTCHSCRHHGSAKCRACLDTEGLPGYEPDPQPKPEGGK